MTFLYLFIYFFEHATQSEARPVSRFRHSWNCAFFDAIPPPDYCRDHHILRKSRFDARSTRLLAWRKIFEYIAWLSKKKKKKKNRNQVWLNRSLPSSSSFTVISGGNPLGRDKDFNSPATETDIRGHTHSPNFLFLIEKKKMFFFWNYIIFNVLTAASI